MASDAELNQANAQPSKRFFVDMLVRDIELADALLDLLDNCVDGILRNTDPDPADPEPYAPYWANFVIGPDHFQLDDNCGGIPIDLARKKAFAIGKPDPITGEDAKATVGMYGIGMKRAIFKLGRNAAVRSWSDEPFEVTINAAWLASDEWTALPLATMDEDHFTHKGTKVSVNELNDQVKAEFGNPNFVQIFSRRVSSVYALIIEKGFSISIRREVSEPLPLPIKGKPFLLLSAPDPKSESVPIAPVVYKGRLLGVDIELYAGMYRRIPDREEQDSDENTKNRSDEAGWTVACNDRVVIDKDRSWVTGWGESAVPNFHNQFIAITGLVLLTSDNPGLLPLTTTKRGVDHGTAIYSLVKDMMREATKKLTDFTNKWRRFEGDLTTLYKTETSLVPLSELRRRTSALPMKAWTKENTIQVFVPKLVTPPKDTSSARISFVADKLDVRKLALVYFDDEKATAKEVGERAFKEELMHYAEAAE